MLKRALDLIISVGLLCVLWPAFLLIAALIELDSEGPVLFKQDRIGRGGKIFKMMKFRTMIVNAEKIGHRLVQL